MIRVRVWGWEMFNVYESLHKDRSAERVCVCVRHIRWLSVISLRFALQDLWFSVSESCYITDLLQKHFLRCWLLISVFDVTRSIFFSNLRYCRHIWHLQNNMFIPLPGVHCWFLSPCDFQGHRLQFLLENITSVIFASKKVLFLP